MNQVLPQDACPLLTCSPLVLASPSSWHPRPQQWMEAILSLACRVPVWSEQQFLPEPSPSSIRSPLLTLGGAESCLFILRLRAQSPNRTAASLPGDGPGESSSYFVLPGPKRSWAGTCPGCSQPMSVDDSGNFSSLDTLLWQRTECLLQTFVKNNFCQGWEIWTLSHQRWRLKNEACVLGCYLVAPCGPWVQEDRQQGQGFPSFCSVAVAWKLAKQEVQVLLPRLAQSPGRQQMWAETEGQGQTVGQQASYKQGGFGQRKSGASGMTGNHTFWGYRCPGSKNKAGKSGNLYVSL